jgi:ribosome-binding factor A
VLGGERMERVNKLLKHELSDILAKYFEVDPGMLVTVTRVSVSTDLEFAKVWVSVLPDEQCVHVLQRLQAFLGVLRRILAGRVKLETLPHLQFMLDESGIRASRIEHILDTMDDRV